MKQEPLPDRLRRIVSLNAFCKAAKLHRRTLQRIMNAQVDSPNAATVALIEQKIRELRPAMKPRGRDA